MSFATFGRRALAPTGGVVTVATMSMALSGERSVGQVLPKLTAKFGETALLRPSSHRFFTTTRPVSLSKPPVSDPVLATTSATKEAAKASTETTAAKSSSGGFVAWYEGHLEARPVVTKMCTGAFLWGLGDFVAQVVPQIAADREHKDAAAKPFQYDYPRTTRAVVYGFGMHAPVAHVHYNFLEWMTTRIGVTGLAIPVFKTIMEQFVYWGWVSNAMYLAAMGALQGHSFNKIYDKISDSIWGLMIAQWVFWIPVQLLNFQFIPVRHQLNVVLITSIVWTALLSFWYPPEAEDAEGSVDKKEEKSAQEA